MDYYNKIILKLNLAEMANYKFTFKAKANVNVSGAFLVNLTNGGYDPIALAFPTITTEVQTFEFTTTKLVLLENSYDIIFQCGGADSQAKGQIEIEFTDFTVTKIA